MKRTLMKMFMECFMVTSGVYVLLDEATFLLDRTKFDIPQKSYLKNHTSKIIPRKSYLENHAPKMILWSMCHVTTNVSEQWHCMDNVVIKNCSAQIVSRRGWWSSPTGSCWSHWRNGILIWMITMTHIIVVVTAVVIVMMVVMIDVVV